MLILRIRRAESALGDGRLDEAFEIARSEDVQAHARGQKLVGRLVRALVERGRALLDQERPQQALADCEKAARLGGNLPELCELRSAIMAALGGHAEHARRHDHAVHWGREQAAKGQLSVAAHVLSEAAGEHAAARALLSEVETRRVAAQASLDRARAALGRQDWPAAIESVLEARRLHASSQMLAELTGQVRESVAAQITAACESGRLDLAEALLERLRPVAPEALAVQNWSGIIENCRLASRALADGEFRLAANLLRKVKAACDRASWVAAAIEQAEETARSLETLQSGPLGWLSERMHQALAEKTLLIPAGGQALAPAKPHAPVEAADLSGLPAKLLLHVDAVGSFLAVRDSFVRVGPNSRRSEATGTSGCEVALSADPALGSIVIERVDDDYFLTCEKPVQMNNAFVKRKLLCGGDQIALSPRCRLKFEIPHPASTSAVLTLSGTRLPGCDARRIVLMDRAMVMGPGPNAHIRADELKEPAVLVVSENRLMCRTGEPVMVDDRPMDRVQGLPMGATVRVGAVQFVVKGA